jgi:Repeat of Unknown Function (DUF347)
MFATQPRIHPIADGIDPIAHGMDAMPDGKSLVRRTMNPIADGMNATPDGMSLIQRTMNPIAHGMNAMPDGMSLIQRTMNPTLGHFDLKSKVPHVTLLFWVIKICATTVGETGGDALSMSLGLGYARSTLIFLAFFAVALGCGRLFRAARTHCGGAFLYPHSEERAVLVCLCADAPSRRNARRHTDQASE